MAVPDTVRAAPRAAAPAASMVLRREAPETVSELRFESPAVSEARVAAPVDTMVAARAAPETVTEASEAAPVVLSVWSRELPVTDNESKSALPESVKPPLKFVIPPTVKLVLIVAVLMLAVLMLAVLREAAPQTVSVFRIVVGPVIKEVPPNADVPITLRPEPRLHAPFTFKAVPDGLDATRPAVEAIASLNCDGPFTTKALTAVPGSIIAPLSSSEAPVRTLRPPAPVTVTLSNVDMYSIAEKRVCIL